MEHVGKEVEIKLRVNDPGAVQRALARLKAKAVASSGGGKRGGAAKGRVYEMNTLFDTPEGGLAKHGQLLRIRVETPDGRRTKQREGRVVLTYKGPSVKDSEASVALQRRYKVREEFEVEVANETGLRAVLEAIGLRGWFRYEKNRTTYQFPARQQWARGLQVQFDETPIGTFLELEGPPEAIDQAAELLGYHHGDYITKSYLQLWVEQARRRGTPPGDLLFPKSSAPDVTKKNA